MSDMDYAVPDRRRWTSIATVSCLALTGLCGSAALILSHINNHYTDYLPQAPIETYGQCTLTQNTGESITLYNANRDPGFQAPNSSRLQELNVYERPNHFFVAMFTGQDTSVFKGPSAPLRNCSDIISYHDGVGYLSVQFAISARPAIPHLYFQGQVIGGPHKISYELGNSLLAATATNALNDAANQITEIDNTNRVTRGYVYRIKSWLADTSLCQSPVVGKFCGYVI